MCVCVVLLALWVFQDPVVHLVKGICFNIPVSSLISSEHQQWMYVSKLQYIKSYTDVSHTDTVGAVEVQHRSISLKQDKGDGNYRSLEHQGLYRSGLCLFFSFFFAVCSHHEKHNYISCREQEEVFLHSFPCQVKEKLFGILSQTLSISLWPTFTDKQTGACKHRGPEEGNVSVIFD